MQNITREGFLYGLAAYVWWGLVPIYFYWLQSDRPLDFVAHRIVWSMIFLAILVTALGRWPETIRTLTTPRLIAPLGLSAVLVAGNWLIYVLCVYNQVIIQASLGYFILPLVNVVLGLMLFRERLRPLQVAAIGIAVLGVLVLALAVGEVPWLSFGLAFSFSIYGLIRKQVPVDGLVGLTVETIVLAPFMFAYLVHGYAASVEMEEPALLFKLAVSGVVTAVPLLCFGQAARRLPFTVLGLMQYLAPSLQFALAILLFNESARDWPGFVFVWAALAIFSIDSYRWYRARDAEPESA
ncbi:MAG: EamA family transporter RarD [Planctomycetes bacterium]|nr:EamA family transporter RarD [Planctomycetota bacterium]